MKTIRIIQKDIKFVCICVCEREKERWVGGFTLPLEKRVLVEKLRGLKVTKFE